MNHYYGKKLEIKAALEKLNSGFKAGTFSGDVKDVNEELDMITDYINSLEEKVSGINVDRIKESKFETILNKTSGLAKIGAWEADYETDILTWDKITREIFEVTHDYQVKPGSSFLFIKDGESKNKLFDANNNAIQHGQSYDIEVEIYTGAGNKKWIRIIGQADIENGVCKSLYGVVQDIDYLKKIETELRINEQFFRSMFEDSHIGISMNALDGRWIKVNKELCNMLGYTEEELLSKKISDITYPEDIQNDLDNMVNLIKGDIKYFTTDKRFIHKNGRIVWVGLNATLIRDAHGNPMHFISQKIDITSRKHYEEQLQKVNRELKAILDSSNHVSIIVTDLKGVITHFGKGSETILGYHAEEMIGKYNLDIIHLKKELDERASILSAYFKKEIVGFDAIVEYARQGKYESREWTYIRKDGSTFPVQLVVSAIKNESGQITGFLGIGVDITKQKQSEEKFKGLLESAPDAMVIVNLKGDIVFVNEQTEKIFGYNKGDLLDKKMEMLIPKRYKDHHLAHLARYVVNPLNRSINNSQSLFGLKKDGTEFPVEISLSPIETLDGTLISSSIRDITVKKEKEEEQKATYELIGEQNKRLLNFALIVSHNLRNHSANFKMLLDLLENAKTDEEKDEFLNYLKNLSVSLNDTIDNLNEIVKVQINIKNTKDKIVLDEFVKKALGTLYGDINQHGVKVKNNVPPDFTVDYNAAYMESILLNLLSNAIKYRHRERIPTITIDAFYENNKPVLQISDNGRGIDLEKYGAKLFGMYKTFHGNSDAKGIGLFITKNQVEAMGGKIEVKSEVDKGSTFKVYLA